LVVTVRDCDSERQERTVCGWEGKKKWAAKTLKGDRALERAAGVLESAPGSKRTVETEKKETR